MDQNVYKVSQLNKYIKMVFDKDTFLTNINVRGEITNFKAHYTGHLYFTLKDESSTIKCVMFKGYADTLKFKPADGNKVVISGQVSVFERDGTYQIYCKSITPEGLGELYIAYEQLKEKLEKEGLFSAQRKRKLPYLPNRVGVITSKTGSVVKDIINVTTRRYSKANLLIFPAAVQGENTAKSVIKAIKVFNELMNVDVIIIARGGGSFEDLFGFNDENLAYEIAKSKIPIISAVGHETDFTICDFVSDLRAPTPSAAAELVYPEYTDMVKNINLYKNRYIISIKNYIERKRQYIAKIKAGKLEKKPLDMINLYRLNIDKIIEISKSKLALKINQNKSRYMQAITKLDALSPLKTLSRGYSVVQNLDGKVINKIDDVKSKEKLKLTLTDGKIDVEVV